MKSYFDLLQNEILQNKDVILNQIKYFECLLSFLRGYANILNYCNLSLHDLNITINYSVMAYDSIDDDLDYDELYYEHSTTEFERMLSIVIKECIFETNRHKHINYIVSLNKYHSFTNELSLSKQFTLMNNIDSFKTQITFFEKI
jgi:hypothetical protein